MGDDADIDRFVLEDGTLLDMQLERGVNRPAADRLLALEADPLEFGAQRLALRVDPRIGEFLRKDAGENAR